MRIRRPARIITTKVISFSSDCLDAIGFVASCVRKQIHQQQHHLLISQWVVIYASHCLHPVHAYFCLSQAISAEDQMALEQLEAVQAQNVNFLVFEHYTMSFF